MRCSHSRSLAAIFLTTAVTAPLSHASDLHVPGQYATIQLAVDASVDGDRIVVAPGSYSEAIDLRGKVISLVSDQGAANTTLDGFGLGSSIITATSGETLETRIQGFRFVRGEGTLDTRCLTGFDGTANFGGAIFIANSALTVEDCLFEENGDASGATDIGGGCLYMDFSDVHLRHCRFERNATLATSTVHGSAIFCCTNEGEFLAEACVFEGNGGDTTIGAVLIRGLEDAKIVDSQFIRNAGGGTGGLFAHAGRDTSPDYDGSAGFLEVAGCLFQENTGSWGAGVFLLATQDGTALLRDSLHIDNEATWGAGAIVHASYGDYDHAPPTARVERCRFFDNRAVGIGSAVRGGGLNANISEAGTIDISDCLFAGNSAEFAAGAVYGRVYVFDQAGSLTFNRCTVVHNTASNGTGGVWVEVESELGPARADLASNVVRDNGPGRQIDLRLRGNLADGEILFSNVEGGAPGTGNIDADPLFRDPDGADDDPSTQLDNDFRLTAGSPNIDQGNPALDPCAHRDLEGNPRSFDGDLDTGRRVDMGAYEFNNVHLAVTGDFSPGGFVTIETTGTPRLDAFLFVATGSGDLCLDPFGNLYLDFAGLWWVLPWGTVPSTVTGSLPPNTPSPIDLVLQTLALTSPAGNTSNAAAIRIE